MSFALSPPPSPFVLSHSSRFLLISCCFYPPPLLLSPLLRPVPPLSNRELSTTLARKTHTRADNMDFKTR